MSKAATTHDNIASQKVLAKNGFVPASPGQAQRQARDLVRAGQDLGPPHSRDLRLAIQRSAR
jgi:hypothetical protein